MGGSQVSSFSLHQVAPLTGKVFAVTGGNSGIGFSIVKGLISKGATVVIASRNADRVNEAVNKIKQSNNAANIHGSVLDLSSFTSIDNFVANFTQQFNQLDGLINNAGVLMPPHSKTEEDFEVTLGSNVLGPAYLTNQLLPLLKENKNGGRIVFLSSDLANSPTPEQFNKVLLDIGGERYAPADTNLSTYRMSKLLDSMYAFELQKRLIAGGHSNIQVYGASPGFIATNLLNHVGVDKGCIRGLFQFAASLAANTPDNGALSSIYAATATIPEEHRGFTFSSGPKVTLFNWKTKAFTPENSVLAFDTIQKAIVSKGFIKVCI